MRGISRSYDVSFVTADGAVRPLSVIAGEISTGKSSILDFMDYCFGASEHPEQIEVRRQARSALLEVEVDDQILVIERQLFVPQQFVWVHETRIAALDEPHVTRKVRLGPPGDATTLNWMLLRGSRLGIR